MFWRENNTPRWLILVIDLFISAGSLFGAFLLRFDFNIPAVESERFPLVFGFVLCVRLLSFIVSRAYRGVVRYTSSKDAARLFIVTTSGSIFIFLSNLVAVKLLGAELFIVPRSILIIDYLLVTFLLISLRVMYKSLYFEIKGSAKEKLNVVIFGAGEAGIITKRTLDRDEGTKYKVFAFVDDDEKRAGTRLEGVSVKHSKELGKLLSQKSIDDLIISVQNLPSSRTNELAELALKYGTNVLTVPPVKSWINGELSFNQIRKLKIEDLLERKAIKLDKQNISNALSKKSILVSGAAGSIGSELVRQILEFDPKEIILLDQAESPLYELELELRENNSNYKISTVIGNIRNEVRMRNVFNTFKPHIVFHAAAYKHVPLMEENPSEALRTNILGTRILADLSVEFEVERFVMVSTDKAVNPTGVMGASKRIAEMYAQSLNSLNKTKFITTRFGNVLGSNGSVIPRFRKQIETGGPVTITHPDITRFFMTIPEASQLVLEAAAMGNGGEIFLFDMGDSVKIVDLAKKMIKLSGLELDKDIKIVYTGLRPGEKLYEELLATEENTKPTHHPQILIAEVTPISKAEIDEKIDSLLALFDGQNNELIVSLMKRIVPEYKSNNSEFEKLDPK